MNLPKAQILLAWTVCVYSSKCSSVYMHVCEGGPWHLNLTGNALGLVEVVQVLKML